MHIRNWVKITIPENHLYDHVTLLAIFTQIFYICFCTALLSFSGIHIQFLYNLKWYHVYTCILSLETRLHDWEAAWGILFAS